MVKLHSRTKYSKKPKKGTCSHHICKNYGHFEKCNYCKRYFCSDHILAKLASTPHFDARNTSERIAHEEWSSSKGHVCTDYYDYLESRRRTEELLKEHRESTQRKVSAEHKETSKDTGWVSHNPRKNRNWNLEKLFYKFRSVRRAKPIVLSLLAVILFCSLNYVIKDGLFNFLNWVAWITFSYYLYKSLFKKVNNLDMADDLKLWGLRIFGVIFAFIGLFLGFMLLFMSSLVQDPLTKGVGILFLGLGILGAFMIFRTNRRYGHIYVNR